MITNLEQDNHFTGSDLVVKSITEDGGLAINLPPDFHVTAENLHHWMIGWGEARRYHDAGCEDLRAIEAIGSGVIVPGALLRGEGLPRKGQRVAFWNREPSGFRHVVPKPVIDPAWWPGFAGKSVHFAPVAFDQAMGRWVMLLNECDTNTARIYAATSSDLVHWEPTAERAAVLHGADFARCAWANGGIFQGVERTAYVSDLVRHAGRWHLFLDGSDAAGRRHIGLAISRSSALGPYEVLPDALISPGLPGTWNDSACFYPKVEPYGNGFIMFFDGLSSEGVERVGMATSKDLLRWDEHPSPVLDHHVGWRGSPATSEPAHIEVRGDSILLLVAGRMAFRDGWWEHRVTRQAYRGRSGNVDDAQLGVYLSVDGGRSFRPHRNNPVFVNDHAHPPENEHLGGNFSMIDTDSMTFLLYQAKSSQGGWKYNVMLRGRRK